MIEKSIGRNLKFHNEIVPSKSASFKSVLTKKVSIQSPFNAQIKFSLDFDLVQLSFEKSRRDFIKSGVDAIFLSIAAIMASLFLFA